MEGPATRGNEQRKKLPHVRSLSPLPLATLPLAGMCAALVISGLIVHLAAHRRISSSGVVDGTEVAGALVPSGPLPINATGRINPYSRYAMRSSAGDLLATLQQSAGENGAVVAETPLADEAPVVEASVIVIAVLAAAGAVLALALGIACVAAAMSIEVPEALRPGKNTMPRGRVLPSDLEDNDPVWNWTSLPRTASRALRRIFPGHFTRDSLREYMLNHQSKDTKHAAEYDVGVGEDAPLPGWHTDLLVSGSDANALRRRGKEMIRRRRDRMGLHAASALDDDDGGVDGSVDGGGHAPNESRVDLNQRSTVAFAPGTAANGPGGSRAGTTAGSSMLRRAVTMRDLSLPHWAPLFDPLRLQLSILADTDPLVLGLLAVLHFIAAGTLAGVVALSVPPHSDTHPVLLERDGGGTPFLSAYSSLLAAATFAAFAALGAEAFIARGFATASARVSAPSGCATCAELRRRGTSTAGSRCATCAHLETRIAAVEAYARAKADNTDSSSSSSSDSEAAPSRRVQRSGKRRARRAERSVESCRLCRFHEAKVNQLRRPGCEFCERSAAILGAHAGSECVKNDQWRDELQEVTARVVALRDRYARLVVANCLGCAHLLDVSNRTRAEARTAEADRDAAVEEARLAVGGHECPMAIAGGHYRPPPPAPRLPIECPWCPMTLEAVGGEAAVLGDGCGQCAGLTARLVAATRELTAGAGQDALHATNEAGGKRRGRRRDRPTRNIVSTSSSSPPPPPPPSTSAPSGGGNGTANLAAATSGDPSQNLRLALSSTHGGTSNRCMGCRRLEDTARVLMHHCCEPCGRTCDRCADARDEILRLEEEAAVLRWVLRENACPWCGDVFDTLPSRDGTAGRGEKGPGQETDHESRVAKLDPLEFHIDQECPEAPVLCRGCGVRMPRREMESLHERHCPKLLVKGGKNKRNYDDDDDDEDDGDDAKKLVIKAVPRQCPRCGRSGIDGRDALEKHEKVCRPRETWCEWCGELQGKDRVWKGEHDCPNRPESCAMCGQTGIERGEMARHRRDACPEQTVACKSCGEKTRRADATAHGQVCPLVKVTCPHCPSTMARKDLPTHLSPSMAGDDPDEGVARDRCRKAKCRCPYRCSTSEAATYTLADLAAHVAKCGRRPATCQYCNETTIAESLDAHESRCEHRDTLCATCGKTMPLNVYRGHESNCNTSVDCSACGESFPSRVAYAAHLVIAPGLAPPGSSGGHGSNGGPDRLGSSTTSLSASNASGVMVCPSTLNFRCPICDASVSRDLGWAHATSCAAREHAEMKPYFGATIIDLGDGVTVTEVAPGGPCEKGMIKVGERIVRLDGDVVDDRKEFGERMSQLRPGDQVDVLVDNDPAFGKGERTASVTIAAAGVSDESLRAFLRLRQMIDDGNEIKDPEGLKTLESFRWKNL